MEAENKVLCLSNEMLREIQSACDDFGLYSLESVTAILK